MLTCHDLPLTLEAAQNGFGIAVAPMTLISEYLRDGALAQAHASSVTGKTYRAVATRDNMRRPATAAFLQWLQGEISS